MDERLGRYRLVKRLGKGGMGEVWVAEDEALKRSVAVKVITSAHAQDSSLRARFVREAQAAAQVTHENVARVYDVGVEGDTAFIAMELVAGTSLREAMKGGAMAPAIARDVAVGIARGLAAAHARGIVHRDMKPENV